MHVACVNADSGVGPGRRKGACVHVEAMREAFRSLGLQVTTFDPSPPDQLRAGLEAAHRHSPIDLVYERYAVDCEAASLFASDQDLPHVVEINSPLIDEATRWRGVTETEASREIERRILRRAALVVAVSSQVAEYATAHGTRAGRVMVAPNGVDTDRFHPSVEVADELAQAIPPEHVVLGFHGRLRGWHGFDRLVEAMETLEREQAPVHLLTVGEGDFAEAVGGRVSAWTHVGWVPHPEVPRYLRRFDVLPLSYDPDQPCYFSPLKLREAMAVGAVPVVPALGDLERIVRHETDGLVYPPGNQMVFIAALRRVVADHDLRERLSRAAVDGSRSSTWVAIAQRVLHRVQAETRA